MQHEPQYYEQRRILNRERKGNKITTSVDGYQNAKAWRRNWEDQIAISIKTIDAAIKHKAHGN